MSCRLSAGSLALTGIAIVDPWALGHVGTLGLGINIMAGSAGSLSVQVDPMTTVSGSTVHASGTLAKLNALLASGAVHFVPSRTGTAIISFDVWDQAGVRSKISVPINVT